MSENIFIKDEYSNKTFKKLTSKNAKFVKKEFYKCTFKNCKFLESQFIDCVFNDCKFINSDLSLSKLNGSRFQLVTFKNCDLVRINWGFVDWSNFITKFEISFNKCTLNHSSFVGVTLYKLNLTESICNDVDFSESSLQEANFNKSDLSKSVFRRTNLSKANFIEAKNYAKSLCK